MRLNSKVSSSLNSGTNSYSPAAFQKAFLVFLFVFELGSLLCGVATTSKMLIVGRAVAGLGGSGLMNGALTIFNSCIPPHKQPGKLVSHHLSSYSAY